MLPQFLKKIINKVLPSKPDAEVDVEVAFEIIPPLFDEYGNGIGVMFRYAEEFNAIAQRHNIVAQRVVSDPKTREIKFHISLSPGDKSDIGDIPKSFKDGLPIVVEYRDPPPNEFVAIKLIP